MLKNCVKIVFPYSTPHSTTDRQHTGSKFEMDVATFGLDFLEECTTQGRTRSPSDGVPLFQGSFCSIIPWHPATNLTAEGHSSGGHDSESVSALRPPGRKDTTM